MGKSKPHIAHFFVYLLFLSLSFAHVAHGLHKAPPNSTFPTPPAFQRVPTYRRDLASLCSQLSPGCTLQLVNDNTCYISLQQAWNAAFSKWETGITEFRAEFLVADGANITNASMIIPWITSATPAQQPQTLIALIGCPGTSGSQPKVACENAAGITLRGPQVLQNFSRPTLAVGNLKFAGCAPALKVSWFQSVEVWGVTVAAKNLEFTPENTGVNFMDTDAVIIDNSTFDGNTGSNGAGLYYGTVVYNPNGGAGIHVSNSTFTNHAGTGRGGAVCFNGSSIATITNSVFVNNSGWFGGAVFSSGKLYIANSTFRSNNADFNITEEDIQTEANRFLLSGGAVFGRNDLSIKDSVFLENYAGTAGGAVLGMGLLGVFSSTFSSNFINNNSASLHLGFLQYAYSQGGAIMASGEGFVFGSNFTNHSADWGGTLSSDSSFYVVDSTISDGYAVHDGGAINTEGLANVANCIFERNRAPNGEGGAIYAGDATAVNSTFRGNVAYRGGAMLVETYTLIDGCTFENNIARPNITTSKFVFLPEGGAVMSIGNVTVVGSFQPSIFSNNTARRNGGAIFVEYPGSANVTNAIFINNSAMARTTNYDIGGGAIALGTIEETEDGQKLLLSAFNITYVEGVTPISLAVSHSVFDSNFAMVREPGRSEGRAIGGAIYSDQHDRAVSLDNATFVDNFSQWGGAVFAVGPMLTLKNSNFSYNYADVTGAVVAERATIINTLFLGNIGSNSGPGAVGTRTGGNVTGSNFTCNVAFGYGSALLTTSFTGFRIENTTFENNIAEGSCTEATAIGEICNDYNSTQDFCACPWPGGRGCDPITTTCEKADPGAAYLGFECRCKEPDSYQIDAYTCAKCSGCGGGSIVRNCTSFEDTVCECPVGLTGEGCTTACKAGPSCQVVDTSKPCPFVPDGQSEGRCAVCLSGYYLSANGTCKTCSGCGYGQVVSECEANADTVCSCPLGWTGLNCEDECQQPVGCLYSVDGCAYNQTDFTKGVRCVTCDEGYYLDVQGNVTRQGSKYGKPYGTCLKVKTCKPGEITISEPTETSNRVCAEPPDTGLSAGQIAGIVIGILVFLILALVAMFMYARKRGKKSAEKRMLETIEKIKREKQWVEFDSADAEQALDRLWKEEGTIARDRFVCLEVLGQGEFGVVQKGVVYIENKAVECAIKETKVQNEKARDDFVREATLMKRLNHPNIVRIYGMSYDNAETTDEGGPKQYLLLEFMDMGDLRGNLLKCGRKMDTPQLVWYCLQLARAVDYLGSLDPPIVHRDIAARNILISKKGIEANGFPIAKLSDLGLAQQIEGGAQQTIFKDTAKVPGRWWAPESLKQFIFSNKTDIWSMGVTFWETFSYGDIPYGTLFHPVPGQSFMSVMLEGLSYNIRLKQPEGCPDSVYQLMLSCWAWESSDRPNSQSIVATLECELNHCIESTQSQDQGSLSPSTKIKTLKKQSTLNALQHQNTVNALRHQQTKRLALPQSAAIQEEGGEEDAYTEMTADIGVFNLKSGAGIKGKEQSAEAQDDSTYVDIQAVHGEEGDV